MLHKQYILFHVMGTLRPLLLQQDSQRRERSRSSVSKHVIWMVFWTSLLTSLASSFLHMLTERKNPGPTDGHEAEDQGTNKDQPHRKRMKQRENQDMHRTNWEEGIPEESQKKQRRREQPATTPSSSASCLRPDQVSSPPHQFIIAWVLHEGYFNYIRTVHSMRERFTHACLCLAGSLVWTSDQAGPAGSSPTHMAS